MYSLQLDCLKREWSEYQRGLVICDRSGYGKVKQIKRLFDLHYPQSAFLGKESSGSNITFMLHINIALLGSITLLELH